MVCKIFFSFCELPVFSWCCLNQSTRADITKYHRLYMTSFNLSWLFNNPVAKYRHMWVRASTHKFWENPVQSKTLCPQPNSRMERGRHRTPGLGLTSHCPDCASPPPFTPKGRATRTCGHACKRTQKQRGWRRREHTRGTDTHRNSSILSHHRPSRHPNTEAETHGTDSQQTHPRVHTHTHTPHTA